MILQKKPRGQPRRRPPPPAHDDELLDREEFIDHVRLRLLKEVGLRSWPALAVVENLTMIDHLLAAGKLPIPKWPWGRAEVDRVVAELAKRYVREFGARP